MKEISGAKPYFGGTEKIDEITNDIKRILKSGNLSLGNYTTEFEDRMLDLTGGKFSLSVSSGGTALELTLQSMNLKGAEVIVPTDTFVATANAVIRAGGIPVFCDINKNTLCIDPNDLSARISPKTAGVIYVHMFGLVPKSFLKVRELCKANGIFLIEDAAHAHGSKLGDENAGNLADAGCFSFYATKILTSGEGGIITTNNENQYKLLKSLRNHGRKDGSNLYDKVSNNYRMSELSCLLALHQIKLIDEIIRIRHELAFQYSKNLLDIDGIKLLDEFIDNSDCSYWRYPIYIDDKIDRLELQFRMMENHKVRITWMYDPLCHMQPVFKKFIINNKKLNIAERYIKKLVCLPCYPSLSREDIARVCSGLKLEINKLKGKSF